MKWYTTVEVIHTETGEIIKRIELDKKKFRIINKDKKYEINNDKNGNPTSGVIKWTIYIKDHEQQNLEFE